MAAAAGGALSRTGEVPDAERPVGSVDFVANAGGAITVAGWAIDPDTVDPIDVHVYVDGVLTTGARSDRERSDVGAAFPRFGARHGYETTFDATPGAHTVCVYAINDGPPDHPLLGCRPVTVIARDVAAPVGALDLVERVGNNVRVAGWAIDPDTKGPIQVHVHAGPILGTVADRSRTDVGTAFPKSGDLHGFDATLPVGPERLTVCVYAINNNLIGPHTPLGCRAI